MSLEALAPMVAYREKFVSSNLKYVLEVREYIREVGELEAEFSKKFESLSRKYTAKRLKNLEKRSKAFDDFNSFSYSSTPSSHDEMWERMIKSGETTARVFAQMADVNTRTEQALKQLVVTKEEEKKKYLDYFQKLQDIQDQSIHEAEKGKTYYFDCAQGVEVAKGKHTAAVEPKQEKKFREQWDEAIVDCNNAKNEYLIRIAGVNSSEEFVVDNAVPRLVNDMTDLGSLVLAKFRDQIENLLISKQGLVNQHLEIYTNFGRGVELFDVDADTKAFASRAQQLPCASGKMVTFSSCTQWTDQPVLTKEPKNKVYLQNVAFKLEKSLTNLLVEIANQERTIEGLKPLFTAYVRDASQGDPESVRASFQQAVRDITYTLVSKSKYSGQLNLIIGELGEFEAGILPHDFNPKSFALPSSCDCCKNNLWEIGKKGGLQCSDCGFKAHSRCELKCTLNCTSHIRKSKRLTDFRQFVERAPPVQFLTADDQAKAADNIIALQSKATVMKSSLVDETFPTPVSLQASPENTTMLPLSPSSNASPSMSPMKHSPANIGAGPTPVSNAPDTPLTNNVSSPAGDSNGLLSHRSSVVSTAAAPLPPGMSMDEASSRAASLKKSIGSLASTGSEKLAIASYNYKAMDENELSIQEGDLLKVLNSDAGEGWSNVQIAEGSNVGSYGLVPSSYIEANESLGDLPSRKSRSSGKRGAIIPEALMNGTIGKNNKYATVMSTLNKDPSLFDAFGSEINKEAIALYDYESTADDDLSLTEGQKITVKSREQEGWIFASDGSKEGYVPFAYIELTGN